MNSGISSPIGNYILKELIGTGSTSEVWLGYHQHLAERKVAIKVLMAHDRDSVARFVREANIAARLQHPNVVRVFDHGQYGGYHCTMLEFIEGGSLTRLIERQGKLPLADALALFRQVATALDHSHALDIVHRDVSPGNILVEQKTGRALLTDFGIAREPNALLTTVNAVMGTPGFWSPEHTRSATEVTHLSDIFSLGVVLYYMLSGEQPWEDTPIAPAFTFGKPLTLRERGVENLPSDADRIIQTMIAADPAKRFPTAQAAVDELERVFVRHHSTTQVVLGLPGANAAAQASGDKLIAFEADGVEANAVETALGPDLVRAPITEAHQRAEELRHPANVARLLDTWAARGRMRRPLLGRLANLHKVSSRNLYFYQLRVLYETRSEPHAVEEPDTHNTNITLEAERDRWQVPLPPAQDFASEAGGEEQLPGSTRVVLCGDCEGKGVLVCPECNGRARIPAPQGEAVPAVTRPRPSDAQQDGGAASAVANLPARPQAALVPCPACEGRGKLRCSHCAGAGRIIQRRRFRWRREARTFDGNDPLPAHQEQWLLRNCQRREIYQERGAGGLRPEWQLVPGLQPLLAEAEASLAADTRIALSELTVSFTPVSDIVFDLGSAGRRGDAGLYRLAIYGFERRIPSDWRFLNWDRVLLLVVGGFCLLLALIFGFFAFLR
jgi:hypothetical protein